MKQLFAVLLGALLLVACGQAVYQNTDQGTDQRAISVLYVGQNPETTEGYDYGGDPRTIAVLKKTRAAEFVDFFSQHFDTTLVYGEDYKPAMSAKYDVTIFDALPMELNGRDMDGSGYINAKAGERYNRAEAAPAEWRWLPDDFDHATIFIAGTLNTMAPDLGLATKFLCNCLGKTIFDLDEDHPIFNTPNKVALNYQDTPYADGVYNYYTGRNLPESTQMLQMEVDDPEGMILPPGIVTQPGVGDSPDSERIASGTSIKSVDSVVIARHGSFLQWGVRAAPRHLTEPARMALINSVHYIKDFKGARRLVEYKTPFRPVAMDRAYKLSDQGWSKDQAKRAKLAAEKSEKRARLLEKVAAGNATEGEKRLAKIPIYNGSKNVSREKHLRPIPQALKDKFGKNWNRYLEYYEANTGYLFWSVDSYKFEVDSDAQQLGIANNNVAILERSIELLEANKDVELARRILARYTEVNYANAGEWRNWFDSNRDKLFFTEIGGYKFVVNTL